jgi:hypothetical protein
VPLRFVVSHPFRKMREKDGARGAIAEFGKDKCRSFDSFVRLDEQTRSG